MVLIIQAYDITHRLMKVENDFGLSTDGRGGKGMEAVRAAPITASH